jgi:hypothetical protein
MKINWGTYIAITFGIFMIFIITLVVKTYQIKVDLVSNDYYEQELKYQEKIDKMSHVVNDKNKHIICRTEGDSLVLIYPEKFISVGIQGNVEFYRPSDSSKDLIVAIQPGKDSKQYLSKNMFLNGLYKMKIEWTTENTDYYTEENIYIQ